MNIASVKNLTDYLNIDKSFFGALSLGLLYLKISFIENVLKKNILSITIPIIMLMLSIFLGYYSIKRFNESRMQYIIPDFIIILFVVLCFYLKIDILAKISDILLGISIFYVFISFFYDIILEKRQSQKLNEIDNIKKEILVEVGDRVTQIEEETLPEISKNLDMEKTKEKLKEIDKILMKISEKLNDLTMLKESVCVEGNLEKLPNMKEVKRNLKELKLKLIEVKKESIKTEKNIEKTLKKIEVNLNESQEIIEKVQIKGSIELYPFKIAFLIIGIILSIVLLIYYYDYEIKFNRFNEIHSGIYLLFSLLLLNSWINENEKIEE